MQIKIEYHKLLLVFFLSPLLFADVVKPSLSELIPQDILPFQIINRANEAYKKEEFRKSAMLFQSLEIKDPTVLYNQANAEYKAGLYDDALKHYDQAKGINEATRLYNVGNSYFKKGDFNSAIRNYRSSLKLKNDEDVMHNLKLAREKRAEKAKKEQEKKDKKREDKEKKKREDEEKKKKEEEQKKKDEQKKQDDKKRDDKKKESDKKNSKSQKDADASKKQETEKKMNPKEKMRKKELSHLIKQLSKRKMPTMMYQGKENKGERNDKNPW